MPSERVKIRVRDSECGACQECARPSEAEAGGLRGFRLVICAFMVFVAPLIAAAVGAGLGRHYGGSLAWSVFAAFAAGVLTIGVARLVTRALAPRVLGPG